MALKKYLKLVLENNSGRTLKLCNYKLEDGGFNNNTSFPEEMDKGRIYEVALKTKIAGNGPKGYADYADKMDGSIQFRICFELSRQSDNPRYVYLLPVGDYVFDGSYKMYGEGIWPKKEDSNDFSAVVRIGKPVKADVFYHITDTQFNNNGENQEECVSRLMKEIIKIETGEELDAEESTIISKLNHVLGIIHTGDICHEDQKDKIYQNYFFRSEKNTDFDERSNVNSNRRWINPFHLLEGYGNHDIDVGPCGSSDGIYYDKVRNMIINRNHYSEFSANSRMPGVVVDSDDHMHYRWKWHE